MSYYGIDGTQGTFVTYDVYANQKQTNYWRWIAVSILFILILGVTGAAAKAFTGAEQASIELPKQALSTVPANPVPQTPAIAAVQDRSPELQAVLEEWVAAQQGSEWAFYVQSLDNEGLKAGIEDSKQFDLASIYKLFLLKPLAQRVPAEAWGNTDVTERSYLMCVDAMLRFSDNPCAETIAANLGWSALHRQNHVDGYKSTVFNRADYLAGSAADTGLLLDRLYHGDGYDLKTKEIALAAMGAPKRTEAIRNGCDGCTVYNKTGDLGSIKHDAAIVEKDGKSYVVVIFSKQARWGQLIEASKLISGYL